MHFFYSIPLRFKSCKGVYKGILKSGVRGFEIEGQNSRKSFPPPPPSNCYGTIKYCKECKAFSLLQPDYDFHSKKILYLYYSLGSFKNSKRGLCKISYCIAITTQELLKIINFASCSWYHVIRLPRTIKKVFGFNKKTSIWTIIILSVFLHKTSSFSMETQFKSNQ